MVHSAGQDNMQLLFEFLRMHRRDGVPLMINEDVMIDLPTMARALARAIRFLDSFPPEVCVWVMWGHVWRHIACPAHAQHMPMYINYKPTPNPPHPPQTPYHRVEAALKQAGFERGWGNTVARARETMNMLADLLEATDADLLQVGWHKGMGKGMV